MNNEINYVSPFKRFCITIGNLPTAYIESMSYYEGLTYLVNYLSNNVIPALNNNGEVVEELQAKFTELKNFVDTYFENLDVQEEINNKLDQMVEDGTMEELVKNVITSENLIQTFDTLNDVLEADLSVGNIVKILGYHSIYDGGEALYKITDNTVFDNVFTYEMDNGKCAELLNKEVFNILQIGAKRNDEEFDNATILQKIFKSGLNNTTVYIPNGTYYTSPINYYGDNEKTNNLNVIGLGKPTLKLLHSNIEKTILGTYTDGYSVSDNIGTLDLGNTCTISTIQLRDNKIYYYFQISDKTRIPNYLTKNMILEGQTSHTKAIISNIDTSDPDGADTARIYLFETYNDKSKNIYFSNTSNVLNEILSIKEDLYKNYLYIKFNDNIIPSYIAVNTQLEQISNHKTARIDKIDININSINYIRLNCIENTNIFDNSSIYLSNNEPFNINSYTGYSGGMLSFNKYSNSSIQNLIFDGNNTVISKFESDLNRWNIVITGGCKNINIENCIFKNSIMAGIQIGGISNTNSAPEHDYPENVNLNNSYFQNNGRGDIEIIYGKNISLNNCVGDGVLDIESNGTEMLNNINIDNCQFYMCTPYSPSKIDSQTMININNSKFFTLLAQARIVLNLNNIMIHNFQPQLCLIKGNNCYINLINGLHGNENLIFTNSSFYGLYQNTPGGYYGNDMRKEGTR